MERKIRVAILCGGKSAEHEVSLQSARNIVESLSPERYEVYVIGIDKAGGWHVIDTPLLTNGSVSRISAKSTESNISVAMGNNNIQQKNNPIAEQFDVVFPVLHGPFGEDGTVQGFLKLANVPFVGAGVLGSAVGMDKHAMKRLLRDAGIPIARFLAVRIHEQKNIRFAEVKKNLGLPLFIKPANLGSSVGVSKVRTEKEFKRAIQDAFQYDTKILIEEYIEAREIECSVLGNENPVASIPGEVIPTHEFYSYEAKYIDEHGAVLEIPAHISKDVVKKIQALAVQTFEILSCEGFARVDFFLKPDGTVLVNEINTIPGFTSISMYPKLWEASGISYTELVDRLIRLAFDRFEKEQKLKTYYEPATIVVKKKVPFYAQAWDLSRWQEFGFDSYEDAKYWEKSSCGVLCLKMAIDAGLSAHGKSLSPLIAGYVRKGVEKEAYTNNVGWTHQGLAELATTFGFSATARERVPVSELPDFLKKDVFPIVSIKWAFESRKSLKERMLFWNKYGGHLALVVGFEEEEGELKALYVHHTSIRSEYNWEYKRVPVDQFERSFTGRCITVEST